MKFFDIFKVHILCICAKESITLLLRAHGSVVWNHKIRKQLITVLDANELATIVKHYLKSQMIEYRLFLLRSNKSKKGRRKKVSNRKFDSSGDVNIKRAGPDEENVTMTKDYLKEQQWLEHAKQLLAPWSEFSQSVASTESTTAEALSTFLPYYIVMQPLNKHFELCTDYLLLETGPYPALLGGLLLNNSLS